MITSLILLLATILSAFHYKKHPDDFFRITVDESSSDLQKGLLEYVQEEGDDDDDDDYVKRMTDDIPL